MTLITACSVCTVDLYAVQRVILIISYAQTIVKITRKIDDVNKHFINYKLLSQISNKYNIYLSLLKRWRKKYQSDGVTSLVSKIGKHNNPIRGKYNRNPSEIDKLKYELLQKEIESIPLKN